MQTVTWFSPAGQPRRTTSRTAGPSEVAGPRQSPIRDEIDHLPGVTVSGNVSRRETGMPDRLFRDRRDAGRVLAGLLDQYRDRPDVLVLGLARGGVPVGYEVAAALGAPLDVFLVRKLGVPSHEELAMGAIASGGVIVINDNVVRGLGIAPETIQRVAEEEGRELQRREQAYREGRPAPGIWPARW